MINENNTVILDAGFVAHFVEDAAVPIDDLIEALEDVKSEGAEYVIMTSGIGYDSRQRVPEWFETTTRDRMRK